MNSKSSRSLNSSKRNAPAPLHGDWADGLKHLLLGNKVLEELRILCRLAAPDAWTASPDEPAESQA